MRFNNIRIRRKLIIIYVVCVLLPLIATNWFVILSVRRSIERDQIDALEKMGERIAYTLNESMNQALAVTDYLCMDKQLNDFISTKYEDPVDYYSSFNSILYNNVINYYSSTQIVNNITLYADNDTIVNGNYFWRLSDAETMEWYQKYLEYEESLVIFAYYDDQNEYYKQNGRASYFSVIRQMDYYGERHVLKLDLHYMALLKSIANEAEQVGIYICDEEKIIFNVGVETDHKFQPISEIEKGEIEYTRPVSVMGDEWMIYLTEDKYDFAAGLTEFNWMIGILVIVNLILPSAVIVMVDRSFRDRIMLTEQHIRKMENGEYEAISCHEGRDEIGNLIRSYNLMVVKIRELIETVYKRNAEKQALEISRKQAELNALQSQMNPHFIFNILESVRMNSYMKGENQTADMIGELGILLRVVLQWDKDFVMISEELAHVKSYLEIQKYRFRDRLSFTIHVQEDCRERKIPKLGILTFVENACVHGIARSIEGGSVSVYISKDEDYLYMEIMDSGRGMTQRELTELKERIEKASIEDLNTSKSIGILNTVVRLKLYYEGNMQIDIKSTENEGTEICVALPLLYNENLKNS